MRTENVVARRAAGKCPARMAFAEEGQQLFDTPARVAMTRVEEGLNNVVRGGMGRVARPSRSSLQSCGAGPKGTVDPLVACLPRHAVQLPERGDRKRWSQVVGKKLGTWVHRCCVTPGPWAPPSVPKSLIHLPPMDLDETVT